MAYRFKLETVLGYRRNLEELAQQKLARELMVLDSHTRRLDELKERRLKTIADFEEQKKKRMAAPFFSFYMDAISQQEREIEGTALLIKKQQQVVAKVRQQLAEKVKDKKVMEKARERDLQKYLREELNKEQKEADEQMVLRFGRKTV